MRCLYCGTEYWLPSQIRRDPDFCSLEHREKYNERMELALRRLQESSAQPLPDRAPQPAAPPSPLISRNRADESRQASPLPPASSDPPLLNIPRMATSPIFERVQPEELSQGELEARVPEFLQIVPDRPPLSLQKTVRYAAAAAVVAIVFWLGPAAAHFAKDLRSASREWISSTNSPNSSAATAPSLPAQSEAAGFKHPLAWLRSAASQRATLRLAENFDAGMAAWGVTSKGWAPGWARSPDGYVRPGQLALFQPTIGYADYRMDFFGQIESNGMSWVVRGKDTQNYYAMKVNLLRPGLRPVLSMAHYPVVQGRQGHVVHLPLSVMIHNGMPYHISVEVSGSHYTASIEGEEIDSWSDDTLLAGGVGFFADPGERARIYWLKVSRNDNWFGRLCGQIAATGQGRDTARLLYPPLLSLPLPSSESGYPIAAFLN